MSKMCCPCLKYGPNEEPRYDEARFDTPYTEVMENLVVKSVPTNMLNEEAKPPPEEPEKPEEPPPEPEPKEEEETKEPEPEPEPEPITTEPEEEKEEKTYVKPARVQPPSEPYKAKPNRYYLTGSPLIPLGESVVVDIKPEAGRCDCYKKKRERDKTVMYMEPLPIIHGTTTEESDTFTQIYKDSTYQTSEDTFTASTAPPPPPPDIQKAIDELRKAQPKKNTPGFPARNQRFIERRTEHVETHRFGPKFDAPIVQYKDSYQEIPMLGSTTDGGETYMCYQHDRYGVTETIHSRSATSAESDITLESQATTPLAEISQVKGTDLKWKIIIKEHKGKKDKKQHGSLDSNDSS